MDMAACLGFRVMWIDMEHTFISFSDAADLCRMARHKGMLAMIRVASTSRENVMKAAECGPDIIDAPMIETPEMIREFVRSARFPSVGVGAQVILSVDRRSREGMGQFRRSL